MKGTTTVPIRSPILSVRLPPIRMVAPVSVPFESAPVMTLMQCMQRTQLLLSISRAWVSLTLTLEMRSPVATSLICLSRMVLVGQRATTLFTSSSMPWPSNHLRARASSVRMLSRQVPMTAMSERWMEFMQSLAQPLNLNLNL